MKRILFTLLFLIALVTSGFGQTCPTPGTSWCVDVEGFCPDSLLQFFGAHTIDDATWSRMEGRSWQRGCPVGRKQLRYLTLPHYDGHGHVLMGEMVCNAAVAKELVDIFRQLFLQRYPIERMELIDNFNGDDEASMSANNTSCFNYRPVVGGRKLSRHAYGMAVDINPRYNPFVRTVKGRQVVSPSNGQDYADRSTAVSNPYRIDANDAALKAFTRRGWRWGGNWRTRKDYQHFQR